MHIKERMDTFKSKFNIHFENEIRAILKEQRDFHSINTDLDEPLKEFIINYTQGGKRVRPFLIYFFAQDTLENAQVLNACLVAELFHLTALIHDDIMDDSNMRRGVPTVHIATQQFAKENKHLGRDIALLLGDMFLTASLKRAYILPSNVFDECVLMMQRTVRGQYLDSFGMNVRLGNLSREEVMSRHLLKTAWYTFGSPARIGALLHESKCPPEKIELLTQTMNELGLLYQIRDDIIDCIDENSGKKLFGDIFENQTTWVTLYIKEHYPKLFKEILKAKAENNTKQLQKIFKDIDLRTPYNIEFQKRLSMIHDIDDTYQDIKEKALEVIELLILK